MEETWRSEVIASDAIGRLIEFWGFKRNMGRVWTLLYLSDEPLTAAQLKERLQISTGAVSMTLKELAHWGVVRRVWLQGTRGQHFTAEGNLWKMVSRVLRERELVEVHEAIAQLEAALEELTARRTANPDDERRAEVQRDRLKQLLELARLGRSLLEALVSEGRVDATALAKSLLLRR
jgi:DNA-binding transcriptional regulator GbsR (MarR family)